MVTMATTMIEKVTTAQRGEIEMKEDDVPEHVVGVIVITAIRSTRCLEAIPNMNCVSFRKLVF